MAFVVPPQPVMASIRAEGIDPAVQKIIAVAVLSLLFLPRFGGIQSQTDQGGGSLAILIVIDGLPAQCICFRQKAPPPVILIMLRYAKVASAPSLFFGPADIVILP